jgi:hypothetical protein
VIGDRLQVIGDRLQVIGDRGQGKSIEPSAPLRVNLRAPLRLNFTLTNPKTEKPEVAFYVTVTKKPFAVNSDSV